MVSSNSFTVGKLDAGMAILIGERASLIEFPSVLLPAGITTGSIVNIAVNRNQQAEKEHAQAFWDLQKTILDTYGIDSPKQPAIRVRNTTQTSVTIEWDELELATSNLRSLDLYRNGQRLSAISNPDNKTYKMSGLSLNTEYSFQLIMRTTAGVYPSETIKVKTHTINDTTGIRVAIGAITDEKLLDSAKSAIEEMGAQYQDKVTIDTTHFVCSKPGPYNLSEYQKAVQHSIPIVQPQWLLACHAEKKMVNISSFYLGGPMPNVKFESRSSNNVTDATPEVNGAEAGPSEQPDKPEQPEQPVEKQDPATQEALNDPEGGPIDGIPPAVEDDEETKQTKNAVRKEIEEAERQATDAAYGHEDEDVAGREGRDDMRTFSFPRVTAVPEEEQRPSSTPPDIRIINEDGQEQIMAEGLADYDYGDREEIDLNDDDEESVDSSQE
ncbi:hypothetical protein E3Q23_00376 [Wallemia mellicola]|uniref:Chitin biosynthesis protein n=1 Tax=Wallemia mellicola TaxID=1708541 RepID=A0A4T0TV03_9BASI|nr:hypothetical protein E3Q23_00376 [Wallemia mellicola]TIC69035.1 hypothetical protein E3Q01_00629 [Wallemia mellicola]